MRKIRNPFIQIKGYNCFACAPHNEHGLRMEFYEDGDEVAAVWEPRAHFQGYGNILHGGIQASLMDELAAWYVYVKLNTAGVTSQMEVKFKKPVYTNAGPVKIRAVLKEMNKKIAIISAAISDQSGTVCSEALVSYFTFPEEIAKKRLYYPGRDAFFEK